MKKIILSISIVILALGFTAIKSKHNSFPERQKIDPTLNQSTKDMKSYISIFEIPATDISRAIEFYQTILDINIEKMEFPGMELGLLPYEGQMVTGVIMKGEGYQPSADGITIYLNGGDNLQVILDKAEKNGGKIIVPKTPHADESGYFAIFLDSEGNKMGLHSPN
ncbi:VOC family protein [Fulvivirgaceae bacterium BMA10]|uniref:VOC family protein n=1 Tax=Splendidivirga corallicola TaxID=3051826 RepID=A0ABT8KUT9_9BACT|nr:VOC family protein [Fulvivirgaceae bacterium BMA10]